jgi:hypothetical protein
VIPRCALGLLFAAMQVQSVRFTYLRYFVPQLRDSFFDGILHDDRLAPHTGRITVKELASTPTNAAMRVNLVLIAARSCNPNCLLFCASLFCILYAAINKATLQ